LKSIAIQPYYRRYLNQDSSSLPDLQETKKQKTLTEIYNTYLQKAISLWIYESGLPLNTCDNDSFRRMLAKIRPGFIPPSRKELLLDELNNGKTIYTLETDGWTDINGNSIINYMVTSPSSQYLFESGSRQRRGQTRIRGIQKDYYS
jgi:hypothetical protein